MHIKSCFLFHATVSSHLYLIARKKITGLFINPKWTNQIFYPLFLECIHAGYLKIGRK